MSFGPVNWIGIVAAVVSCFIVGGLWYSPLLFVNAWLSMSGVDRQRFNAGLPKALVGDFVSALAIALVLNQVIRWAGVAGALNGATVGLIVGVGFMAAVLLTQVTYERRPFGFFAISAGYRIVTTTLMGAILAAWP